MSAKVAVLTATRDRLRYTRRCFRMLRKYAGEQTYHHYVYDQASQDGTRRQLQFMDGANTLKAHLGDENIGISRAMNHLIGMAGPDYDFYVKFDNDCELTEPGTLRRVVDAMDDGWILSPRVEGLKEPPAIGEEVDVNGERVGVLGQIGGIFMCIPAWVFHRGGFRYSEQNPKWGMDDVELSRWFQQQGGRVGYLLDCHVNHIDTTVGQEARYPEYFNRKYAEMGIA